MIPDHAVGFVASLASRRDGAKIAMAATLSSRRNSLSYSAERKVCEAHAACAGHRPGTAIYARSRNSTE